MLFVDKRPVAIGQTAGLSRGGHRRRITLAEYGFRPSSAVDDRPRHFGKREAVRPRTICVATGRLDATTRARRRRSLAATVSMPTLSGALLFVGERHGAIGPITGL